MDRRKALILTTKLLGGTVVGSSVFLSSCYRKKTGGMSIDNIDVNLLDEIGETILPESDRSPGAKAARVGEFMQIIVTDCYSSEEARIFIEGIEKVNNVSKSSFDKKYMECSQKQKLEILTAFDKEAKNHSVEDHPHFFTMMKQLCIWGYFTSEPGATRALRYNPIPGRYEACIPYTPGESAWA